MGGEVGVEREVGKGSTFWLSARFQRGVDAQPVASTTAAGDSEVRLQQHHRGSHILLVEDNAINCEVAMAMLDGAELRVDTAIPVIPTPVIPTKLHKFSQKKAAPRPLYLCNWSGREDSNFRPPQPHCGALPGCATPRHAQPGL